jgi:hypothetical protein
MVTALREETKEEEIEIIKSDNWELPVMNLGTGKYAWRPKTAILPYYLFEGPTMTRRTHGINLGKDLSIGVHGHRGATKTLTLSYLSAKKLRMGHPVWGNWPVSFYVIEPNCWDSCQSRHCEYCYKGAITYYENMPLEMDKVYTFNSELSEGAVGFTEFQYYVESRTSGRQQNRFLSYQIMQIRKSALSFFYDVQNPKWVDNRFGWSDDVKIFCRDLAKMNYDFNQVGREIEEGEYSHWKIQDISGVLTGMPYEETGIEYGPYQFDGFNFWWIYPTRWKVDVYDAVFSMKQDSSKSDRTAQVGAAIAQAVNYFLELGQYKVLASEMWAKASEFAGFTISPTEGGKVLSSYDVPKSQNSKGKWSYHLNIFMENNN